MFRIRERPRVLYATPDGVCSHAGGRIPFRILAIHKYMVFLQYVNVDDLLEICQNEKAENRVKFG
jgi:hypothetical protein